MNNVTYLKFWPWRSAREYQGQVGSEVGKMRLPAYVVESLATSSTRADPEQYAVRGEWVAEDGRRWLDFAVTTEWIEANTDHRWDPTQQRLRLRCQSCGLWDGKHRKGCEG